MGASLVKNCFGADCWDGGDRRESYVITPQSIRAAHFYSHDKPSPATLPSRRRRRRGDEHNSSVNLEQFTTLNRQKRDRWDSRESTCSSSSSADEVTSPSFGRIEECLPSYYVLEDVIGAGTTSKCYRCRRLTDGRIFACKVINKRRLAFDRPRRDVITRQLRREVEVLRQLDHPNIAKLEDSFENDTYMILIMELLEGGELFDTIIERGRLRESDAKHIAASVLSAMSYMHAQGVVHRDIKPENLLLAKSSCDAGPVDVKIIDFGFSKTLDSTQGTTCSFLGTGGYLAPEILQHQPYTSAVDMWAFGILLYMMLCGRLPFATRTQLEPGQSVKSLYRLSFPQRYWRGVSDDAQDLLRRLLVLQPSSRVSAQAALEHPWFSCSPDC
ncbi:hypothetical protein P43SY_000148 [Pythium insidiosum]|uniref:Protein kinase domain-containing protein n=1 Tax=Pythium insidiosum TaxID=114742 RepID=A0AAD5Q7V9_PYTIN|nr:hypothetical protein P43SY_000148 [Pythium insidiosum]